MRSSGFTLIEVMVSVAIMTVVGGILYMLSLSMAQGTQIQEARITTVDDGRGAMLVLVRELRQSAMASINWTDLPGEELRYRVADDVSDTGVPVDTWGRLELSPVRIIQRDTDDLNEDGLTDTQLVLIDGGTIRVLANGLDPDEGGLRFERADEGGIRIQVATERPGPNNIPIRTVLTEVVLPRNG